MATTSVSAGNYAQALSHRNSIAALLVVLIALDTSVALAQQGSLPGSTYESISRLPDWSGWWGNSEPFPIEIARNPPPLRSEVLAALGSARAAADIDPDPTRFCRPYQFVGYSGGFVESVEFLFTPGRVTITNEMGLIRRIYTDGRTVSADTDASNTGTSVGRWEGTTLVVETVGINRQASYPGAVPGAVPIGRDVKITERIKLTDRGALEFDIETIAPQILTAPDRRKRTYVRVPKAEAREITFCTEHDRSIDPATGKQRFDMTPPTDLPPPPPSD